MSDEQKSALEVEREALEAKAKESNDARTGKGLRVMVGATRGKNTQNITYEAFDQSKPDTLPTTLEEFASVTGVTEEAKLVEFLIDGFNDYQYRQASDPIAEFINRAWPDDVQAAFRITVRNYAKMVGVSIEEASNTIRPSVEANFVKSLATA